MRQKLYTADPGCAVLGYIAHMSCPRFIAHRGAGTCAPENTMAAFELGAALGHTAFECDVKLSADDVCVLLHDDTLERTTNGQGPAAAMRWADLRQLDAGTWLSPDFAGEPLASLADIARLCCPKGYFVNLEIKPSPGTDTHTARVVANSAAALWAGQHRQLLLSSFSHVALQAAQAAQPQLARAHLFKTLPPQWLDLAQDVACQGVVLHHSLVSPHTIAACHAHGLWCASYTVNDPEQAQRFIGWGLDHLITDAVKTFKNPT
jgi:glycerophosphoryl diester phosphodiesterase